MKSTEIPCQNHHQITMKKCKNLQARHRHAGQGCHHRVLVHALLPTAHHGTGGGQFQILLAQGAAENLSDWIGLRKNLQETIDFPIKYGAFL